MHRVVFVARGGIFRRCTSSHRDGGVRYGKKGDSARGVNNTADDGNGNGCVSCDTRLWSHGHGGPEGSSSRGSDGGGHRLGAQRVAHGSGGGCCRTKHHREVFVVVSGGGQCLCNLCSALQDTQCRVIFIKIASSSQLSMRTVRIVIIPYTSTLPQATGVSTPFWVHDGMHPRVSIDDASVGEPSKVSSCAA